MRNYARKYSPPSNHDGGFASASSHPAKISCGNKTPTSRTRSEQQERQDVLFLWLSLNLNLSPSRPIKSDPKSCPFYARHSSLLMWRFLVSDTRKEIEKKNTPHITPSSSADEWVSFVACAGGLCRCLMLD